MDREDKGRLVRQVWVDFAKQQDNPKPHHLLPWEELDEDNKEVDRRIGDALFNAGVKYALSLSDENKWTMKPAEQWKPVSFYPLGSDTPTTIYYACPDCGVSFIVPVKHECPPSWMAPKKPVLVGYMGDVHNTGQDPDVCG